MTPPADNTPDLSTLDDPFAAWNVDITPRDDEPRVLTVAFDSPVLGRRTECMVWVPDHYRAHGDPVPVCWFLHGTVTPYTHPLVKRLAARAEDRGRTPPVSSGRERAVGPKTMGFDELLDDARFLVVAPDAGRPPWCPSCNWVNGPRRPGLAAETHLHDEAMPLIEALFTVRTDRNGRALTGHSMGGGGAAIQGFRHPDRFGFVGCSSGVLSLMQDHLSRRRVRWLLYNRSQGFKPLPADEIHYRNNNLLDLAPNVVGSGIELVVVIGTATESGEEYLPYGPEIGSSSDVRMESVQRRVNDEIAHRLTTAGVPFTYVTRTGYHSIGRSTFQRFFRERMESVFERGVSEPETFSYKNADRTFSAWGYDVAVTRPNTEFLHLLRARTDGTDFTLAGSGTVEVATPARFDPESTVTARVTRGTTPRPAETRVLPVGPDGRVEIALDLGPTREDNETSRAVAKGTFPFPHTRVEIDTN